MYCIVNSHQMNSAKVATILLQGSQLIFARKKKIHYLIINFHKFTYLVQTLVPLYNLLTLMNNLQDFTTITNRELNVTTSYLETCLKMLLSALKAAVIC